MSKRCLGLCVAAFSFVLSVSAQSSVVENGGGRGSEEELAASKRLGELLRKPTFITLRLVSVPRGMSHEKPTDAPPPYIVGDWIGFQLLISQSLSEPILFWEMTDPYDNTRVELFKDGDIVPYSKEAQANVDRTDKRPSDGSGAPIQIQPGSEHEWVTISLKEWYEPLGPGHYQLSVRRRFAWDGEWVQSSSVTFDVMEKVAVVQRIRQP